MQEIHGIRDLLIATIAPEMGAARDGGAMRKRYPDLDYDQAIVAWVLDALTVYSLERLADARAVADVAQAVGAMRLIEDENED
jgi:hypothetical protein